MLYVSNLPFSFEDADLKGVFAGFDVTQAYVATRRNGRSKGFGFVTFANTDQQKKALTAIDGKELDGRKLTVKVAHKDDRRDAKGELRDEFKTEPREPRKRGGANKADGNNNNNAGGNKQPAAAQKAPAEKKPSETVVYVSNLPFEFTDAELAKVFAAHKPTSARIARRRNDRSKGFGFVEFANSADQKAALALDGHNIGDRQIQVKVSVAADRTAAPAQDGAKKAEGEKKKRAPKAKEEKKDDAPKQRAPKSAASDELSETTVYVSNLPFDLSDAALSEIFSSKGTKPVSAHIARKRDQRSKGFGFVQFASNADQKAALALDGSNLQDRPISVKVAKKGSETRASETGEAKSNPGNNNNNADKKEGEAKRKRRPKKAAGEGGDKKEAAPAKEKKPSDTLVYVSNLAFEVDDNALAKLFDGFTIKSAHVAVRRNGRSKGFGFVEFASHAEQVKALAKSGTSLEGRVLTVEVAHEKLNEAAKQ